VALFPFTIRAVAEIILRDGRRLAYRVTGDPGGSRCWCCTAFPGRRGSDYDRSETIASAACDLGELIG
jgi:hypothetical protein